MSIESQFWHLRNHKLFWQLDNSQIKQLCIITKYKHATKGENIFFNEESEKRIFLLKKGTIKIVFENEHNEEIIIDIIEAGELFGILPLSDADSVNEHAVVLSNNVIICTFLVSDWEKLLSQNAELAVQYIKFIGIKMARIKNKYTNLFFKDVRSRLLLFIKDQVLKQAEKLEEEMVINNYLTHNEIAKLICASRQTTTQLLNDLEKENIIEYNRKEWKVNVKKLDEELGNRG